MSKSTRGTRKTDTHEVIEHEQVRVEVPTEVAADTVEATVAPENAEAATATETRKRTRKTTTKSNGSTRKRTTPKPAAPVPPAEDVSADFQAARDRLQEA